MVVLKATDQDAKKAYRILVTQGFAVPEPISNELNKLPSVLKWLKTCIACGVDVNARNHLGLTPLHILASDFASYSLPNIVDFLCRNGADVNLTDYNYNRNALMWLLCNRGWQKFIDDYIYYIEEAVAIKLVLYGTNLNHQDSEKRNVLCYMTDLYSRCSRGLHVHLTELMLEKGLDVSGPMPHEYEGYQPLQVLFSGIPSLEEDGYGRKKTRRLVHLYLKYDLDINSNVDCEGNNLLLYVLWHSRFIPRPFEIAQKLIERGTNVNKRNAEGSNALHMLCTKIRFYGRKTLEMISLLIENGIDVYAEQDGETVLSALCNCSSIQEISLRIIRHIIINHKIAVKMPVVEYLHLLLDLVLERPMFQHPSANNTFRLSLLRKGENDFYAIMNWLITSAEISNSKEKEAFNQTLVRICGWYDGENILQIIRLLCDHGADVNVLCDGNVRPAFRYRFFYIRTDANCMELIGYNRFKKCSDEEAYHLLLQYGFNHIYETRKNQETK